MTAGVGRPRCELRWCAAGVWETVAAHDLPDLPEALPDDPATAAEHLAGLLLRDETRQVWEGLRDASQAGLCTLVQVDPPELRRVPWELLALDRKHFPDRRHPVVRARDLGNDDIRLVPPLRLLMVVGEPGDRPDFERVTAAAGGRIDVEVLVTPTDEALAAALARMRPHVLHAAGISRLAPDHGRIRRSAPRLVVLDRLPAATALVDPLLDAGARAVLTVPASTEHPTATAFAATLYAALAGSEPIDVAVAHAREVVDTSGASGFLPDLTVRVRPQHVLHFAGRPFHPGPAGTAPADPVGPLLELAETQLARGDASAPTTFRAAAQAASGIAPSAGRVPLIRERLAVALTRLDRLREAGTELDELLASPVTDAEHRAGLRLLRCEVDLRCGRVTRAAAPVRYIDGHRAAAVAVRAALTGPRPATALSIAGAAGPGAAGMELAGIASAELMRLDEACRRFTEAAAAWFAESDPDSTDGTDGAVRCHARSAVLLIREHGHLTGAADHLAQAAALDVAAGSPGWLRRSAAQLELLHRQGRVAEVAGGIRTTLDALRDPANPWTPPHRVVRFAVGLLAVAPPAPRRELLDLAATHLRSVTPPAARAVLLRGLRRVPELTGETDRLHDLSELVRDADRDPALTTPDRALLTLTLAELDRLSGRRTDAEAALAFVRDVVPSPLARRAWWAALDRLGPPVSRTVPRGAELAAVAAETDGLPMLGAAFLIERAEALLEWGTRPGRAALVRRLVEDARRALAEASERNTRWHTRLSRIEDELTYA